MTLPIGSARVTVHADTDPFEREVEHGVRKGADAADDDLKVAGHKMGETLGDSMGDELEKQGPHLARSVERGLKREVIKTKTTVQFDSSGNEVKRWVSTVTRDIEDALKDEGRQGGPLNVAGRTISDAIGSGFNVSGRSPLIALLIPVIGEIGLLIGGLVQAAGALVAYLYLIPNAIGAIAIQAGVLYIAFQGVGAAIQGAFAAKNARELQEAIKGLTPEAQDFVKSLLPLRDIFKQFQGIIQGGFFAGFEGAVKSLISALTRGGLAGQLGIVAFALGRFFKSIIGFLDSGSFQRFLYELIPATVRWINDFGPALLRFLSGLATLGHAVMPFFEAFGKSFNSLVGSFGDWLASLASNPEFLQFIKDAQETMAKFGAVLKDALVFLVVFWQTLKKAGGDKFLTDLSTQLQELTKFFRTELGQKALEGLIHLIQALAFTFISLLAFFLALLGAFEYAFEWIRYTALPWLNDAGNALHNFFSTIGNAIRDAWNVTVDALITAWNYFVDTISPKMTAFFQAIGDGIARIPTFFWEMLMGLGTLIANGLKAAWDWAWKTFIGPAIDDIKSFFSLKTLYDAGRNLIQGLINGVKSMFPNIGGTMSQAAALARSFWPFSPAKEGPLSGKGDPLYAGQNIIKQIVAGIQMETPTLQAASSQAAGNVIFGPGAVKVGFEGAVPTPEQAQITGAAAGRGIINALAARNTRLQVRTM